MNQRLAASEERKGRKERKESQRQIILCGLCGLCVPREAIVISSRRW
jgi:hypothetical protein